MTKIHYFLFVIVIGLITNLLANMIWKYIPKTNTHIEKIITIALVIICIFFAIIYWENKQSEKTNEKSGINIYSGRDMNITADKGGQNIFAGEGSTVHIGISMEEYRKELLRQQKEYEKKLDQLQKTEIKKRQEIKNKLILINQKLSASNEFLENERQKLQIALLSIENLKSLLDNGKLKKGEIEKQIEQMNKAFIIGDYESAITPLVAILTDYKNRLGTDSSEFQRLTGVLSFTCSLAGKICTFDSTGKFTTMPYEKITPSETRDMLLSGLKNLRENIKLKPGNAETWNKWGDVLRDLKQYPEAVEAFKNATELKPDYYRAWYNLCDTYCDMEQYSDALDACEQAIKLSPNRFEAYNCKGRAISGLGRYDEAIVAFEKATQLNNTSSVPWRNMGKLLFEKGRYEDSAKCFESAVKIDRLDWQSFVLLGLSYYNTRQYSKALSALDNSIALKPDNYYPYLIKSECFYSLGRGTEAVEAINNSLLWCGDANKYEILEKKGLLLSKLGKLEDALAAFEESIKLNEKYFFSWYDMGVTLGKLSRYQEALDAFKKAISINPKDPDANKYIEITQTFLNKQTSKSN